MFSSLHLVVSAVVVLSTADAASMSVSSMHEVFMQQRMRSEAFSRVYVSGTAASGSSAGFAESQWAKFVDPEKQEAVELLRFITGYKSALDTFVDVTSMTPMLQNADPNKLLELYGFIGTFVNNNSASMQAYMNNVTQKCSATSHSEGNGWSLSVDLGFTAPKRKDKIHPRKVVPLLSNAMFADARFGKIDVYEAMYDGHVVTPVSKKGQKAQDFEKDVSNARNVTVFRCNGGSDEFLRDLQLAAAAQKIVQKRADEADTYKAALKTVQVKPITTSKSTMEPGQVAVTFEVKPEVQLTPGLPVYFSDAVTDAYVRNERMWENVSMPFEPMGTVVSVKDGTAVLKFSTRCVPSAANMWEPKLKVPVSQAAIDSAKQFVIDAMDLAKQKHEAIKKAQYHDGNFMDKAVNGEVIVGTLVLDEYVGHINLKSLYEKSKDGQKKFRAQLEKTMPGEGAIPHTGKVCVVTEQAAGRFVDKSFDLPKVENGERVVAHFTATGHGWANTDQQCGEFCKMKYNISFDGDRPAQFMQWRDDCNDNPTGNSQYGTWWESRNGWCPGSVSAGVYFDITDSLKKDSTHHRLTIDLSVLNRDGGYGGSYQPYTNLKGWLAHDQSVLNTDLKVYIYPKEAVQAAREFRGKSCSKAHAALQGGSLEPFGAFWPSEEKPLGRRAKKLDAYPNFKKERSLRDGVDAPSCSIDFEATAPWHMSKAEAWQADSTDEITWVSLFKKKLIQSQNQVDSVKFNRTKLPKDWGQVGLRLRLERPDGVGLDFDHWDRIASIGLVVDLPLPPPVPQKPELQGRYSFAWWLSVVMMSVLLIAMLTATINTSREKWLMSVSKRDVTMPIKRSGKAQFQSEKDLTYGSLAKDQ